MKIKISVLLIAIASVALFFGSKGMIVQDSRYHLFADNRKFLGIPNAMDVLTNIFFLVPGFFGLREVMQSKEKLSPSTCWLWFFISILLISPGSALYHWSPDNFSLIWDRLPMSMGFMALYIALISEHINLRFQKYLSLSLMMGIFSVLAWAMTSDLRLYFIIQFSSFVTIPLVLILFPSRFTGKLWYLAALLFYGVAKWAESHDRQIFEMTNQLLSGHSLKHILASLGLLCLWWMIKTRETLHLKNT